MDISQGSLLEKTVRRLQIQKILEIFFEAGSALFSGLFLLLSIGLLLDHGLLLPAAIRQAYWASGGLVILWILWKYCLVPCLHFSSLAILTEAENRFPNLSLHLKSAWELSKARAPQFHSQALEKAHLEKTEQILKESPAIFLPFKNLIRALVQWLFISILLGIVISRNSGNLNRILWPWSHENLSREVAVSPGDALVDWGKSIEVRVSWKKSSLVFRDYQELKIQVETPHGFETLPWDSQNSQNAVLKFLDIHSPLKYRIAFHGSRTRVYSILPNLRPHLLSVEARTKNVDSDWNPWVENSTMAVLAGHILEIRGEANQNLKRALIVFEKGRRSLHMNQTANGDYRAKFLVSTDMALRFDLESKKGEKNAGISRYWIKVQPDLPPTVQILYPQYPVEGSQSDSLPISYLAEDDGGIVQISLSLSFPDGQRREVVIENPGSVKEFYGDYSLNFTQLPVGVSELRIKAVDNATPAHISYSVPLKIKVIDFSRLRRQVKKAWKEAEKSLSQLADSENKVLSALNKNAVKAQKQAALSKAAAHDALEKMDQLRQALRRDPYLNSALKSSLSSLRKRLGEQFSKDFSRAEKNQQSGNSQKAEEEHKKILDSARQASRFLSQAEKLEDLEEAALSASQMKNQASDMSSRLDRMSREKHISKSRKEEIQKEISSLKKEIAKFAQKMAQIPHSQGKSNSPQIPFPLKDAQNSLDRLSSALASGDYQKAAQIARQLEREMEEMKSAMSAMAQNSVFSSEMEKAARQLAKAREALSEAIEKERAVKQETEWLEKGRLQNQILKEKELLARLAKMQGVLVSSAASYGEEFPPFILSEMRQVKAQLESGSAGNSVGRLLQISNSLRQSKAFNPRFPWDYFSGGEDRIRKMLEKGVPEILAETRKSQAEAQNQEDAKRAAESALKQLKTLGITVQIPESSMKNLSGAVSDEKSAQEDLSGGRSQGALTKEESALSQLSQGLNSLDESLNSQQSFQASLMESFGGLSTLRIFGGRSLGEGVGARMNLVPLPAPKDYQPLKKMRREIEKSMGQKAPPKYQGLFKDYLRRIAQ